MASQDDDAFTGFQATVFLLILGICGLGMFWGWGSWKEESRRARCEGLHDNLECRVAQQIRSDARLEIKRQEQIIRENQ